MSRSLADTYLQLTGKCRTILAILVAEFDTSGEQGLTRRQIAERLGQYRLYPHDDRAIKQLEALGFIHIAEQRLGDDMPHWYGLPALSLLCRNIVPSGDILRENVCFINWAISSTVERELASSVASSSGHVSECVGRSRKVIAFMHGGLPGVDDQIPPANRRERLNERHEWSLSVLLAWTCISD